MTNDASAFHWVAVKNNGQIPATAVTGGLSENGNAGYIAKVKIKGAELVGKCYSGYGANVPYKGKGKKFANYECLCWK